MQARLAVAIENAKAQYKARLAQQFLTQNEIRIELQPTEEGVVSLTPLSDA